jgi:hypothetical protein
MPASERRSKIGWTRAYAGVTEGKQMLATPTLVTPAQAGIHPCLIARASIAQLSID